MKLPIGKIAEHSHNYNPLRDSAQRFPAAGQENCQLTIRQNQTLKFVLNRVYGWRLRPGQALPLALQSGHEVRRIAEPADVRLQQLMARPAGRAAAAPTRACGSSTATGRTRRAG